MKITIITGSFHKSEADLMVEEVKSYCRENDIDIAKEIWVPGSMEKPLALKKELADPDVDGVVMLGIIERGETKHGLVMANVVIDAIVNLSLEFMKPVGVGILGPEILPSQIPARVKPYAKKAVEAVRRVLTTTERPE